MAGAAVRARAAPEGLEHARAVVDARRPDLAGRRKGSTLCVLPLVSANEPFGLVILESLSTDVFEDVRSALTLEERDRMARRMHDGMAQDIAFLGYELDVLRSRAARTDPELAGAVAEVRTKLTGLISDIRLSITDLRTSFDADRGSGRLCRAVSGLWARARTPPSTSPSRSRASGCPVTRRSCSSRWPLPSRRHDGPMNDLGRARPA